MVGHGQWYVVYNLVKMDGWQDRVPIVNPENELVKLLGGILRYVVCLSYVDA